MGNDHGYPHPDAVTPEVQAMVDKGSQIEAKKTADLLQSWERIFEALKANPKALARLDHIMNHTGATEDGETLFINAPDAAEVYTILFMAWSAGKEYVEDLVRYMDDEKDGSAITGIRLMKVKCETEEETRFEAATADTSAADVVIATDWT